MDGIVTFNQPTCSNDTAQIDCTCETNPDVAGLGVIVAFIVAALLTTIASCSAAVIDEMILADTAMLPQKLNRWLSGNQDPETRRQRKAWRNVLDHTVLSLADQQLATGFSLAFTAYIVYGPGANFSDAHFAMAVYLCCLSSSSHLASIITLRKSLGLHRRLVIARIVLVTLFACMLVVAIQISDAVAPFTLVLFHFGTPSLNLGGLVWVFGSLPILWIFWASIMQLLPDQRRCLRRLLKRRAWPALEKWSGLRLIARRNRTARAEQRRLRFKEYVIHCATFVLYCTPGCIFFLQVVLAILSILMILLQKFARSEDPELCTMADGEENEMTFGQILPVVLLFLPFAQTVEAYYGEFEKAEAETEADSRAASAVSLSQQDSPSEAAHSDVTFPTPVDIQESMETVSAASSVRAVAQNQSSDALANDLASPRRVNTEMRVGLHDLESSEGRVTGHSDGNSHPARSSEHIVDSSDANGSSTLGISHRLAEAASLEKADNNGRQMPSSARSISTSRLLRMRATF